MEPDSGIGRGDSIVNEFLMPNVIHYFPPHIANIEEFKRIAKVYDAQLKQVWVDPRSIRLAAFSINVIEILGDVNFAILVSFHCHFRV